MTVEEVELGHYNIHFDKLYKVNPPKYHAKLSIEFAISVMEDMLVDDSEFFTDPFDVYMNQGLREKIKELKQHLNG